MRVNLRNDTIRAAQKRGERAELWDAARPGLFVVVTPAGHATFYVKYRAGGRQRKLKLGTFGDLTISEARAKAGKAVALVNDGRDPAQERQDDRTAPTMAELVASYVKERVPGMKPSTQVSERNLLSKHVLCEPPKTKRKPSPCAKLRLASRKVADVTKADVERVKVLMRDTPGAANKVIGVLSRLFSYAEDLGWRASGTNPCRGVRKNPEKKIERFLTADERQRLEAALTAAASTGIKRKGHVDATAVACFRLLLWTGMRLGEGLDLRWRHVDVEHKRLVLDDSKEKNRAKVVHLPAPAVALLEGLAPEEPAPDDLVFATSEGKRLSRMQRRWQAIRDAAGLPKFRIHDCRHAWASSAVMSGVPLHVVGRALGHASPSTTNRYAHLAENVVAAAVEKVGAVIEADSTGQRAEVLPMRRRRRARQ